MSKLRSFKRALYEYGILLLLIIYAISEIALQADVDIEKVPDAVPRGDFKPLQLDSSELTFLVLDLETTDLSKYTIITF